jgi:uncharacterized protein YcnI
MTMKDRLIKLGIAALVALAIPASMALAHGPDDAQKGLAMAASHAVGSVPSTVGAGKPDAVDKPADVGSQPQDNHGWFVSQAAKDHSTTGRARGAAVSAIARGDQGKPAAASH